MNELRIFIADDHQVMREGLTALLNAQPDMTVIGEAGNGKEAYQRAKELRPDLVIMDVSMPELNGVQATENLKQACPETKVLVLTAFEDADYLRQMLKVGASGYLLKHAASEELTHAIRTVAAGGVYLDPIVAGKMMNSFLRKPTTLGEPLASELSERETEVLRLIAWGHTNKEVASQLHLSVHTVETYKTRLMHKLNFQNRADVVRYALRRGWLAEG
jgi:DNA-binding NarL/FixJ family response regulator